VSDTTGVDEDGAGAGGALGALFNVAVWQPAFNKMTGTSAHKLNFVAG
jgi:hypothetical protein